MLANTLESLSPPYTMRTNSHRKDLPLSPKSPSVGRIDSRKYCNAHHTRSLDLAAPKKLLFSDTRMETAQSESQQKRKVSTLGTRRQSNNENSISLDVDGALLTPQRSSVPPQQRTPSKLGKHRRLEFDDFTSNMPMRPSLLRELSASRKQGKTGRELDPKLQNSLNIPLQSSSIESKHNEAFKLYSQEDKANPENILSEELDVAIIDYHKEDAVINGKLITTRPPDKRTPSAKVLENRSQQQTIQSRSAASLSEQSKKKISFVEQEFRIKEDGVVEKKSKRPGLGQARNCTAAPNDSNIAPPSDSLDSVATNTEMDDKPMITPTRSKNSRAQNYKPVFLTPRRPTTRKTEEEKHHERDFSSPISAFKDSTSHRLLLDEINQQEWDSTAKLLFKTAEPKVMRSHSPKVRFSTPNLSQYTEALSKSCIVKPSEPVMTESKDSLDVKPLGWILRHRLMMAAEMIKKVGVLSPSTEITSEPDIEDPFSADHVYAPLKRKRTCGWGATIGNGKNFFEKNRETRQHLSTELEPLSDAVSKRSLTQNEFLKNSPKKPSSSPNAHMSTLEMLDDITDSFELSKRGRSTPSKTPIRQTPRKTRTPPKITPQKNIRGDRVYICESCDKRYKNRNGLAYHLDRCSGREKDDDGEIRCVCSSTIDDNGPMVQCDDCLSWLHLECVNLTEESLGEKYFCPHCVNGHDHTFRKPCPEIGAISDEEDDEVVVVRQRRSRHLHNGSPKRTPKKKNIFIIESDSEAKNYDDEEVDIDDDDETETVDNSSLLTGYDDDDSNSQYAREPLSRSCTPPPIHPDGSFYHSLQITPRGAAVIGLSSPFPIFESEREDDEEANELATQFALINSPRKDLMSLVLDNKRNNDLVFSSPSQRVAALHFRNTGDESTQRYFEGERKSIWDANFGQMQELYLGENDTSLSAQLGDILPKSHHIRPMDLNSSPRRSRIVNELLLQELQQHPSEADIWFNSSMPGLTSEGTIEDFGLMTDGYEPQWRWNASQAASPFNFFSPSSRKISGTPSSYPHVRVGDYSEGSFDIVDFGNPDNSPSKGDNLEDLGKWLNGELVATGNTDQDLDVDGLIDLDQELEV